VFSYSKDFKCPLLVNTLLTCLNENELSSLIPYVIDINKQSPLFEYGKFIRKICHGEFVKIISTWFESSSNKEILCDVTQDDYYRVQRVVNTIYNMVMRQGSNLQVFYISNYSFFDSFITDLPKFSKFVTYKPGIENLRSLVIRISSEDDEMRYQNFVEFLTKGTQIL